MIKTKKYKYTVEKELITEILCNNCGEACTKYEGPGPNLYSVSGLIETEVIGGYFSTALEDNAKYRFSLCENCLVQMFLNFKIPVYVSDYNSYDRFMGSLKINNISTVEQAFIKDSEILLNNDYMEVLDEEIIDHPIIDISNVIEKEALLSDLKTKSKDILLKEYNLNYLKDLANDLKDQNEKNKSNYNLNLNKEIIDLVDKLVEKLIKEI